MPVPQVCSGKYSNIRAVALDKPTPPGNSAKYNVYYKAADPAINSTYFTFSDCEVTISADSVSMPNVWSHIEGRQEGNISGKVTLKGFLPIQKSLGLYIGRRIQLFHDWSMTGVADAPSPIDDKSWDIVVLIDRIVTGIPVKGALSVVIDASIDERTKYPVPGSGGYIWDQTGYGFRPTDLPEIQTRLPWRV